MGRQGEAAADVWLRQRGWLILDRRWRCRLGEIDIVGLDGETLVFVEVKARNTDRFGSPEAAVHREKRLRITRTAVAYLRARNIHGRSVRFDVLAVGRSEIRHIPGAFEAEGYAV